MNITRKGEGRILLKILSDKPTGNRFVGRPQNKWEDSIRMYDRNKCQYEKLDGVSSVNYYWKELLNLLLNLRVPQAIRLV